MRPDLANADRAAAVREAARAWRQAGVIDAAAFAAVEERFPDDRVRVGTAFRALLFLFTLGAVAGAFGVLALGIGTSHDGSVAALAALAGIALAALTELQLGALRRRQGGTEAATSLAALCLVLSAAAWWLHQLDPPAPSTFGPPVLWLLAAVLAVAASWRWGYSLYAGAAAAALLAALARLPAGRLLWIALPLAAAPALLAWSESPRLPPAHRGGAAAALLVALGALYIAVHVGSWDGQLVEGIGGHAAVPPPRGDWRWWSAALATAALPALVLAAGIRRRRPVLLAAGTGAAVASLATLPRYVEIGPTWLLLTLGGGLGIALALALWRRLDSGPGGERGGFTAAPLFGDRGKQAWLETGVAVLAVPAPARTPEGGQPAMTGGGGRAGGAGATGEF